MSQKSTVSELGNSALWGIHIPKGKRSLRARRIAFNPTLEVPSGAGGSREAALTPVHPLPGPIRTSAGPPRPTDIPSAALPGKTGSDTSAVTAGLRGLNDNNPRQGASQGLPHPHPVTVPVKTGMCACCMTTSIYILRLCFPPAFCISNWILQCKSTWADPSMGEIMACAESYRYMKSRIKRLQTPWTIARSGCARIHSQPLPFDEISPRKQT